MSIKDYRTFISEKLDSSFEEYEFPRDSPFPENEDATDKICKFLNTKNIIGIHNKSEGPARECYEQLDSLITRHNLVERIDVELESDYRYNNFTANLLKNVNGINIVQVVDNINDFTYLFFAYSDIQGKLRGTIIGISYGI